MGTAYKTLHNISTGFDINTVKTQSISITTSTCHIVLLSTHTHTLPSLFPAHRPCLLLICFSLRKFVFQECYVNEITVCNLGGLFFLSLNTILWGCTTACINGLSFLLLILKWDMYAPQFNDSQWWASCSLSVWGNFNQAAMNIGV